MNIITKATTITIIITTVMFIPIISKNLEILYYYSEVDFSIYQST